MDNLIISKVCLRLWGNCKKNIETIKNAMNGMSHLQVCMLLASTVDTTCCLVTLDKWLNLSEPQSPHLWNWEKKKKTSYRLAGRISWDGQCELILSKEKIGPEVAFKFKQKTLTMVPQEVWKPELCSWAKGAQEFNLRVVMRVTMLLLTWNYVEKPELAPL